MEREAEYFRETGRLVVEEIVGVGERRASAAVWEEGNGPDLPGLNEDAMGKGDGARPKDGSQASTTSFSNSLSGLDLKLLVQVLWRESLGEARLL